MTEITWVELDTVEPESTPGIAMSSPESAAIDAWKEIETNLLALRRLECDWDGLGASAPDPAIVDSALAMLAREKARGTLAPRRVNAGPNGEIAIEWQSQGVIVQVEIWEPGRAVWTERETGKRAVSWEENFDKKNQDELWEALPTIEILGPESVVA